MNSRRQFISLLGGVAAAWPVAASAEQTTKIHRIGFLWDSPAAFPEAMLAFRQQMRDLGYVEDRNLLIDYRWAEGKIDRMREMARELVQLKADVIIAPSSVYTAAAKQATSSIPIVFFSHADPLRSGHVANLARPGGNATGLSLMMTETNVKLLELLKDAVPARKRVAVIFDPAIGQKLKAAHPRHVDVGQDQNKSLVTCIGDALKRHRGRLGKFHREPANAQIAPELLPEQNFDIGLIINDENEQAQARSPDLA